MTKIREGAVFNTNEGGSVTVISREGANKVIIEHQDESRYRTVVCASSLHLGAIRNPYRRSIFGVGYLGVGDYRCGENGETRLSYLSWRSMLLRCYSDEYLDNHPSYRECSVCEEWHNFQVFAEWYFQQPNAGKKGFDLDKDLRVLGNKVYSPETCSFVPQEINKLLCDRASKRGELPQGVCRHGLKFKAQLSAGGKRIHLGIYKSPPEAHLAYRKAKERYVKHTAEEYKNSLHPQVYHNLMNWTLDSIEREG